MKITKDNEIIRKVTVLAFILTFAMMLYNSVQINAIETTLGRPQLDVSSQKTSNVNLLVQKSDIIPTGKPQYYGDELGFLYDDIDPYNAQKANQAISKLGNLDRTLNVEGANLQRYIKILYHDNSGISCEFCCGARSVIFENGQPACGCAHSYAMRGITKYLILNHPDMKDKDILKEVARLKILFFPTIHEAKAQVMEEKGIEFDEILLATNEYRGIEKGTPTGSAMVGGC